MQWNRFCGGCHTIIAWLGTHGRAVLEFTNEHLGEMVRRRRNFFFQVYYQNDWQTKFDQISSCFIGRHFVRQNKRLLRQKAKSWHYPDIIGQNPDKSWHFWKFDFILTLEAKILTFPDKSWPREPCGKKDIPCQALIASSLSYKTKFLTRAGFIVNFYF